MRIEFYDTTLRDGAQSEDVSFSLTDKLLITERLDDFGIHYIEGGWPGSNPKDAEYFRRVREIPLKRAKIVAFSSTFRTRGNLEKDDNVKALLDAETEYVTIVGKSWDLHVRDDLRMSLDDNLRMIERTVRFLRDRGRRIFFDAEHFFDGYKRNRQYAKKVLKAAEEAGAELLVLCDTNGGTMPYEVYEIVKEVKHLASTPLGIHTHNDSEMAVASSIMAIRAGCSHVQGTINGYGERCGNANLCSVIPIAILKMGHEGIERERLRKLRELSLFVDEMANFIPDKHRPFVGESAFAHKGGIHVSAVKKNPETYEHIRPELVGNRRRVLVSELSGTAAILEKAKEYGIELGREKRIAMDVLRRIKELEMAGYEFEGAEASLELLLRKMLGQKKTHFELLGFKVIVEKEGKKTPLSQATVMLKVDGRVEHTAALGNGPVNALDNALRKALYKFYPSLKEMELVDYKVRVLSTKDGTKAKTRVLMETTDKKRTWGTVGVSENIIEASYDALVDSIEYKLEKEEGLAASS